MLIPTNTKTIFGCETPMSISRDTEMSSYTASVDKGATKADPDRRQGLVAAGGVLGALAASSCCILPLRPVQPGHRWGLDWESDRAGPLSADLCRSDHRHPGLRLLPGLQQTKNYL